MEELMEDITIEILPPHKPLELDEKTLQFKPTRFVILPNGSIHDTPSYAFVGTRPDTDFKVVLQISDDMLKEALREAERLRKS
jgi:hypothetical protein